MPPKIKFSNRDKSRFYSTVKANVDGYFREKNISRHANAEMVFKTVILLGTYVGCYALMLLVHLSQPALIMTFVVQGIAIAGIGMAVMHDANHNAYSSNEKINRWVGYSLNMIGGAVFNWKLQHNVRHHTYTNIHGHDDDINEAQMMRLSPHKKYNMAYKLQHIYAFFFYSLLTLYWVVVKDFVQTFQYRKMEVNRSGAAEFRQQVITVVFVKLIYLFCAVFVPIYFFHYAPGAFILGFVMMHMICGLILSVVFQLAHTVEGTTFPLPTESNEIENDWAIHQMNTTANFARHNRLLNWYVGGLNFQVEHHLFPTVCHVHYPAISEIVKKTAGEFDIPYLDNPSFTGALYSHVLFLKHFGSTDKVVA